MTEISVGTNFCTLCRVTVHSKKTSNGDALANGIPSDDPFSQSTVLNCCTFDVSCALHIVLFALQTTVGIKARVAFSNGKSCLCSYLSAVYIAQVAQVY